MLWSHVHAGLLQWADVEPVFGCVLVDDGLPFEVESVLELPGPVKDANEFFEGFDFLLELTGFRSPTKCVG